MENKQIESTSEQVVSVQQDTAIIADSPAETLGNSPPSASYTLRKEGDSTEVVRQLTERYHLLESINWSTTDRRGELLSKKDYPGFFFNKGSRIPNLRVLQNYAYWNCDLGFEVEITAPKMAFGVLAVSWCYDFDNMELNESTLRANLGSICSMDHHLIHAETNAKIRFVIPYKSYKPYGLVDNYNNENNNYNMFRLFIAVLSPLKVNLSQASSVDVQVRCCLLNVKLSGLRMAPQSGLLDLLVKAGERLLDTYFPDPNRDLPTDIREPQQVILRNSQQLCVGKGIRSVTYPLRLDVTKTTPYSNIIGDELKLAFLVSKWGLVAQFKWNTTHSIGETLKTVNVSSMIFSNQEKGSNGLADFFEMPPVAIVASAFTYWRGSLEFKFVCSTNAFVAGKLIIAFVPSLQENFSLDDLSSSYYTTYELGAEVEFIFKTPFIFDRHYAQTSTFDGKLSGEVIGKLVVMTYSRLGFPMNEASAEREIEFSLFVRGSGDIEFAVPRQPVLGLGVNRLINKMDSYITAKSGYDPVTVDTWRSFDNSMRAILRYGSGTDHVAQFNSVSKYVVYKCERPLLHYNFMTKRNITVNYLAVPFINDGYDDYLAVISDEMVAQFIESPDNRYFAQISSADGVYVNVGDLRIAFYSKCKNIRIRASKESGVELGVEKLLLNRKQFGEEFSDLKDVFRRFNVYGDSYRLVPKDFSIGKVIFRIPIRPSPLKLGIQDNGALTAYRRITREGPIALLSSCFRYFRGSLRFKLIFLNCNLTVAVFHDPLDLGVGKDIDQPRSVNSESMVNQGFAGVVQDLSTNNIIDLEVPYYKATDYVVNGTFKGNDKSRLSLGTIKVVSMCALKIETPVSVNVYYALGDDARFHTYNGFYGMVNLFDISQKNKDRLDARNIAFRKTMNAKELSAFLSRRKCDESDFETLSSGEVEPQMLRKVVGIPNEAVAECITMTKEATKVVHNVNKITADLADGNLVEEVKRTIDNVNRVVDKADSAASGVNNLVHQVNEAEIVNNLEETAHNLKEETEKIKGLNLSGKLGKLIDSVLEQLEKAGKCASGFFADVKERVYNVLCSILHVIIHPTMPTFAVSLGQLLINLKLFSLDCFSKLTNLICKLLKKFKIFKSSEEEENPPERPKDVTPQFGMMDIMDENDLSAAVSLALSLMANSLKIGSNLKRAPLNYFKNELSKDLKNTAQTSNILFVFFRNSLGMFVKMYKYLISYKMNHKEKCLNILCEEDETLIKWYNRSAQITNPLYKNSLRKNPNEVVEAFILRTMGERYSAQFLISNSNFRNQFQIIKDMTSALRKITDELTAEHLAPQVRFEPYCFQLVGGTKVGKSFVSRKVILHLLNEVGIRSADPIFTRNPGPEYMNGIECQPCFYVDDFLQLLGNGCAEEAIAELFCLKSSATFNPSIAQLEKKNLRYNPALVFLCSNRAFYDGLGINMLDMQALHRRRDALWEMRVKKEYLRNEVFNPREVKRSVLESFGHVEFRKYEVVEQLNEPVTSPWVSYQQFLSMATEDFKQYYHFEMENYRRRLQECSDLLPEMSTGFKINDLVNEFNEIANRYDRDEIEKIKKYVSFNGKLYNNIEILRSKMAANVMKNDAVNMGRNVEEIASDVMGVAGLVENVSQVLGVEPQMSRRTIEKNISEKTPLLDEQIENKLPAFQNIPIDLEEFPAWHSGKLFLLRGELSSKVLFISKGTGAITAKNRPLIENCPHRQLVNQHNMRACYWNENKEKIILPLDNGEELEFTMDCCSEPANCLWSYSDYKKDFQEKKVRWYIDSMSQFEPFGEWIPELKEYIRDLLRECGYKTPPMYEVLPEEILLANKEEERETYIQKCVNVLKEVKNKTVEWSKVAGKYCLDWLSRFWKWGAVGLGIFGLAYVGFRSAYRKSDLPTPVPTTTPDPYVPVSAQAVYDGGARMHAAKARLLSSAKMRGFVAQPQSVRDILPQMATKQDGIRMIMRNSGYIYYHNRDNRITHANFFGINGNNVLIPGHMLEEMCVLYDENPDFSFIMNIFKSGDVVVNFSDCRFSYDRNQNSLAVLTLPRTVPAFRNIRPHIATAKEHSIIAPHDCTILRNVEGRTTEIPVTVSINSDIVVNATSVSREFTLPACYQYNVAGEGMCGSVLFRNSPSFKIIGLHIAGNKSKIGFAEPIFYEQFEEYTKEGKIAEPEFGVSQEEAMVPLEGCFLEVGVIPRDKVIRLSPNSQYEPTPMHGELRPVLRQPSILTMRDKRAVDFVKSPLAYGIAKHGNPPIPFKSRIMERSVKDLTEKIIAVAKPVIIGSDIQPELSDQQIFGGVPGIDACKRLELHTSEGYPLQLERPESVGNKSWLFVYKSTEEGNILYAKHSYLEELHNLNMEIRRRGDLPMTIFVDSLKDELVKENKLKPGGTRVFSVSPLEFTWTIKKYFGWFQAAYTSSRIKAETAIGINPDSSEWAQLFRYINEVQNVDENQNQQYMTGDYSAFGDCLQSQCIIHAFDIMIEWYKYYFKIDEEGVRIRKNLCIELLNSIHLAQNVMYKTFCGIPSGFALTVEINSLVNCLYMRNAWQEITKRPLAEFGRDVRLVTYGDDLLMKVARDIGKLYNFNTIQQYLKSHNIAFTPASKDPNDHRNFIPLSEVNFLKREFKPHPTRRFEMLGPLPESSVTEMLNWSKKNLSKTPEDRLMENCRGALLNAYGKGPDYYGNLRKSIVDWWAKRGVHIRCETWQERDEIIFN